jgi:hypothetical protein
VVKIGTDGFVRVISLSPRTDTSSEREHTKKCLTCSYAI